MKTSCEFVQTHEVTSWNSSWITLPERGARLLYLLLAVISDTGGGKMRPSSLKGEGLWSPFDLGCTVFHRLRNKMHPPAALTCAGINVNHKKIAIASAILSPYSTVCVLMHARSQCLLCGNDCSTREAPGGGSVALFLHLSENVT